MKQKGLFCYRKEDMRLFERPFTNLSVNKSNNNHKIISQIELSILLHQHV